MMKFLQNLRNVECGGAAQNRLCCSGILRGKSGVSLIIAIIFVSAFLLVMAGLLEADLKAMESMRNRDSEGKVRYLAESAAEMASYWVSTNGVGQNIDSSDIANRSATASFFAPLIRAAVSMGILNCENIGTSVNWRPCVSFSVTGHAAITVRLGSTAYYSVPLPGTGDAAEKCTSNFGDTNSANDECNWNRLYLGQNVEIPLYTEATLGGTVSKISGPFKLRIRTPRCTSGEDGCVDGRIELYPPVSGNVADPYRHVDLDPVLVQWSLSDAGGGSSLIANDSLSSVFNEVNMRASENDLSFRNTELSSGRINAAKTGRDGFQDYIILKDDHEGINQRTEHKSITAFTGDFLVQKPLLRFSMVAQPKTNTSDLDKYVPYLEYQFLSTSNSVSDSKAVLRGTAEISGFKKIITKNKQRKTGISGFVLESF